MRIGVLTFHKAINYGAYLQAYSLSSELRRRFPDDEVELVDYIAPKEQGRKLYVVLRSIKHYGIKAGLSEVKRIFIFNSMQKYLPLSPKSFCTRNLERLYSYIEQRYDMLIIGSDAVFNWNQTKFPSAFIPDYPFTIPVYTYAASVHGLRFYSVAQDILQTCGSAFARMEYVGVRDRCSEQFVKLCFEEAKTIHCCDPTLFIDTDEIYRKGLSAADMTAKKYGFLLSSKYIVVMAPDSDLVRELRSRYGSEYRFVSVFTQSAYSDCYISEANPFEWTVILRHAAMVITSYFHGTLLSLVQGTPAVALDYSEYCDDRYEGKLKDLMITRFGLPELYYSRDDVDSCEYDESFFRKVDEILVGGYTKRIRRAVERERKAIDVFVDLLKEAKGWRK